MHDYRVNPVDCPACPLMGGGSGSLLPHFLAPWPGRLAAGGEPRGESVETKPEVLDIPAGLDKPRPDGVG